MADKKKDNLCYFVRQMILGGRRDWRNGRQATWWRNYNDDDDDDDASSQRTHVAARTGWHATGGPHQRIRWTE